MAHKNFKRLRARMALALVLTSVIVVAGAGQAAAATTVYPTVDCIVNDGGGLYTAYFGYENSGGDSINWAIGDENSVVPGEQDQGQPTDFNVGYYPSVFAASFSTDITSSIQWEIDGQVATASTATPLCTAGSTGPVSDITSTSATLWGQVDALGPLAVYVFEWGTDPNNLQSTAEMAVASNDPQLVSAQLQGLTPDTTYYYQLDAGNGRASTTAELLSFTTAPASTTTGTTSTPTTTTPTTTTTTTTANPTPTPSPADLTLTAKTSATGFRSGQPLRYTFAVGNRGRGEADEVTLHVQLPASAHLRKTPDGCRDHGLLTCSLGTIVAGGHETISFTVTSHAHQALSALAFLTTTSPNSDPTGPLVTLHTAAWAKERGSSSQSRHDTARSASRTRRHHRALGAPRR